MSGRYAVSAKRLDFGRETEITVVDRLNPAKRFVLRIPELYQDDVEEMLMAIVERLRASKEKDRSLVDRLEEFFEEGALERGEVHRTT